MNTPSIEALACTPAPLRPECFNDAATLPYGLTVGAVQAAMQEFLDFLGFINVQLHGRGTPRFESMLMQANFSSMVGEFMKSSIPKYSHGLAANRYHNGHPDLVPAGVFANDMVQHGDAGIEIKGSRYLTGWQGHNAEDTYLIVFSFDSNRPVDENKGIPPRPFRFLQVAAGLLQKSDWTFAGRSNTSRRTITATVNRDACQRMILNHIYRDVVAKAKRTRVKG
ncbi:MAG: hypothetical protein ACYC2K_10645 [Gemmatimonadales bacterium]